MPSKSGRKKRSPRSASAAASRSRSPRDRRSPPAGDDTTPNDAGTGATTAEERRREAMAMYEAMQAEAEAQRKEKERREALAAKMQAMRKEQAEQEAEEREQERQKRLLEAAVIPTPPSAPATPPPPGLVGETSTAAPSPASAPFLSPPVPPAASEPSASPATSEFISPELPRIDRRPTVGPAPPPAEFQEPPLGAAAIDDDPPPPPPPMHFTDAFSSSSNGDAGGASAAPGPPSEEERNAHALLNGLLFVIERRAKLSRTGRQVVRKFMADVLDVWVPNKVLASTKNKPVSRDGVRLPPIAGRAGSSSSPAHVEDKGEASSSSELDRLFEAVNDLPRNFVDCLWWHRQRAVNDLEYLFRDIRRNVSNGTIALVDHRSLVDNATATARAHRVHRRRAKDAVAQEHVALSRLSTSRVDSTGRVSASPVASRTARGAGATSKCPARPTAGLQGLGLASMSWGVYE